MVTAKTPWKDQMGDLPMHLDYFEGSMYEAVAEIARKYPRNVAFDFMGKSTTYQELLQQIETCAKALKTVGMYDYRKHAPHLLSGGQKQRVAIAGVLAMEPKCIVLDEPTAMLDPHGRAEVISTIEQLNREKGITVILITHHMSEAIRAERVIVMDQGKILLDGTPKEVFVHAERLKGAGLDVPVTTQIISQLNRSGARLPLDALSIEECAQTLCNWLKEEPNVRNH